MFIISSVFCLSSQDSLEKLSLKQIDELIIQTDFDSALKALSNYIISNPEDLDRAQSRIDKIMKAKNDYAVLASHLVDLLAAHDEDYENHLKIISRLEELEKHPTEENLAFIRLAKKTAQFVFYNSQFEKIMASADADAGKAAYVKAVNYIQTGFYMYREEFYQENTGENAAAVREAVKSIEDLSKKYADLQNGLNSAFRELQAALKARNLTQSQNAWKEFNREAGGLVLLRNSIFDSAINLERIFEGMKETDPELTDASYIPFISHFTLGRSNGTGGITGIMDMQLEYYIETLKPLACDAVIAAIGKSTADVSRSRLDKGFNPEYISINTTSGFSSIGKSLNGIYARVKQKKNGETVLEDPYPLFTASMDFIASVSGGINASVDGLIRYRSIMDSISKMRTNPVVAAGSSFGAKNGFVTGRISYFGQLQSCIEEASSRLGAAYFKDFEALMENAEKDAGTERIYGWLNERNAYSEINGYILSESEAGSLAIWKDIAGYFNDGAHSISGTNTLLYDQALALFEGITAVTPAELNPSSLVPGRYPAECIEAVSKYQHNVSVSRDILTECLNVLDSQDEEKYQYAEEKAYIRQVIAGLDSVIVQSSALSAAAREESLIARSALERARQCLELASRSLDRKDFDGARRNLDEARKGYVEYLSHQESAFIRSDSDKRIAAIGERITEEENKLIVPEVRRLITSAKNEFYSGNFDAAEKLLNQAQSRWSMTNTEENAEIKDLLVTVGNAKSMQFGRVLSPTSPLYPEMSQILSIAHQYHQEGAALVSAGKRAEGTALLEEARKKLQELQMVYPLNHDAAVLTLKIEQVIAPKAYKQKMDQKFNNAKKNYKVKSMQNVVYNDLLDMEDVQPDYPGLSDLLYNTKLELGYIKRPPDQNGKKKAAGLIAQAKKLSASGNADSIRQAISLLDQAIVLDADNDEAYILKDRLQVSSGGKASVVLTAADEVLYNRAIMLMQQGDTENALDIVNDLKKRNPRSTKVLDLEKDILIRR